MDQRGGEARVLVGVARARFERDALRVDAHGDEQAARVFRFARRTTEQRAAAAGVDDPRRGIAAGEDRRLGQALRAFIEGRLAARAS